MFLNHILIIIRSLYFNFKHLPFRQAIKIPIYVEKLKVRVDKGSIVIDTDHLYRGMIRLGVYNVGVYPDSGCVWENNGSTIIFKGKAVIGNDCYLCFGQNATIVFGVDFVASAGVRIVGCKSIEFGKCVRLGWETLVMDTNMHPLWDIEKKQFKTACGAIRIGDYNWFATQCKVLHSVVTPEHSTFATGSIITRGCEMKANSLMGGIPLHVLSENVVRRIGEEDVDIVPF